MFYQTVIMVHKTVISTSPMYMKQKLSKNFPYKTRQATGDYKRIPADIRASKTLPTFKSKHKKLAITNIKIT